MPRSNPDKSTDPTVIEYAVRFMHKGKTPRQAAVATKKKLHGFENLMLGGGVVEIDEDMLEVALYARILELAQYGLSRGWTPEDSVRSALQSNFYQGFDDKTLALVAKVIPEVLARMPRSNPSERVFLDEDLHEEVVAEAKARFAVWPSAYASGWVTRTYKERGGRFGGKARGQRAGLTKWFGEEWVDLSRPVYDEDGELVGYEPCGREQSGDPASYPKCRPLKEAMQMTPEEVEDAVRRKRRAEKKAERGGRGARAPVRVATYRANPDEAPADLWEAISWANDGYLEADEIEALRAEIEKHPRVRVLDEVLEDTFLVEGRVVSIDGDDFKVLSPSQWVADEMESFRSDIKDKVELALTERFNEDFQEGPVTLWHATPSENLDSILKQGLRAENRTRGLTNRGVSAAIFTSDNEETAMYGSYGDTVLAIDCKAMKRDGISFSVEQEPAVVEREAAGVLASAVGAADFDWYPGSDGADDPSTVILRIPRVPPKYLRVVSTVLD